MFRTRNFTDEGIAMDVLDGFDPLILEPKTGFTVEDPADPKRGVAEDKIS